MTNQHEEIEEEKTVPVKNVAKQELVYGKAYQEYVRTCDYYGMAFLSFNDWVNG